MKDLKWTPIVYAVGDKYIVTVPVDVPTVMWVKVGEECYYDHSNGVLRSDVTLHKMTVPQDELDREARYTLCWREVIERKPYFSDVSEIFEQSFEFTPVKRGRVNVYHIADAHGDTVNTVASARRFEAEYGKIDLLVLNGDIVDHSGDVKNFSAIHKISADVSGGKIPVLCVRGNHDLRGICAEKLSDYIPTAEGGKTYYTFRLGGVWGLVLDCAEDKNDDHPEYGNCNCCHAFRREQTKFIENVIENSEREYRAEGVEHRLVIAHNPFTRRYESPFNIEEELYAYWVKLIGDEIKPELLLSGHLHSASVTFSGDAADGYGQKFPTVVGSIKDHKTGYVAGCGLILDKNHVTAAIVDNDTVVDVYELKRG